LLVVSLSSDSTMASVDTACRNAFCSSDTDSIGIGTTESTLVSRYGEGLVTETRTTRAILDRTHCYFLPQNNMWVEFVVNYHHSGKDKDGKVEEVFVSKEQLCDKKYVPENPSGRLSTAKGISIGDSVDLIHERYGEPSLRINTVERETQTPSLKGSRF